MFGIIYLAI